MIPVSEERHWKCRVALVVLSVLRVVVLSYLGPLHLIVQMKLAFGNSEPEAPSLVP
jgi:hypothetical protein